MEQVFRLTIEAFVFNYLVLHIFYYSYLLINVFFGFLGNVFRLTIDIKKDFSVKMLWNGISVFVSLIDEF